MKERGLNYDYATRNEQVYDLMSKVSAMYNIKNEDIIEHGRKRLFVDARGVFCTLAHKKLKLGFAEIGRYLNRDHSTIMYLIERTESFLQVRDARVYPFATAIEKEFLNQTI